MRSPCDMRNAKLSAGRIEVRKVSVLEAVSLAQVKTAIGVVVCQRDVLLRYQLADQERLPQDR